MTQSERIFFHLRTQGPITGAQAMSLYGIVHLASRISEMRRSGCPIKSRTDYRLNKYGEKVHFSVYYLEE